MKLEIRHHHNAENIMLRREILENIDTTNTLLDPSSPMNLKVKHQFLDQPVLTTSGSGGRDLNPDHKSLSTSGLGNFFKSIAIAEGYPESTSFCSWDRGTATIVDRITFSVGNSNIFRGIP